MTLRPALEVVAAVSDGDHARSIPTGRRAAALALVLWLAAGVARAAEAAGGAAPDAPRGNGAGPARSGFDPTGSHPLPNPGISAPSDGSAPSCRCTMPARSAPRGSGVWILGAGVARARRATRRRFV